MNLTPIRDIRHFESSAPVEQGKPFGRTFPGTLYPYSKRDSALLHLGERYARKLAEYGFSLPGYHHLYVSLTPSLKQGEALLCDYPFEKWMRFVSVGMPPADWVSLDEDGKFRCLVALTTSALERLCDEYGLSSGSVRQVEEQVLTQKAALEILYKQKETTSYAVRVTYQIAPQDNESAAYSPSIAYVEYTDKKSGKNGKTVLAHLKLPEDLFFLVSSISVSRGVIRLTPAASFRASLYTKRYSVPLEVPVERVLMPENGQPDGGRH
jgi:hypothetical protein